MYCIVIDIPRGHCTGDQPVHVMVNLVYELIFNKAPETQDSYDDPAIICMLYFKLPWGLKEMHAELDGNKNDDLVKESYAREGGDT